MPHHVGLLLLPLFYLAVVDIVQLDGIFSDLQKLELLFFFPHNVDSLIMVPKLLKSDSDSGCPLQMSDER